MCHQHIRVIPTDFSMPMQERERQKEQMERAEREASRWRALMLQREASRRRAKPLELVRQQKRASVVLKKIEEREQLWQCILRAAITIQAFMRGLLTRRASRLREENIRRVRAQGQLCAHQAAWQARQLMLHRLMLRQHAIHSKTLGELEKVQRRLTLAIQGQANP